jgi:hypothetical protein
MGCVIKAASICILLTLFSGEGIRVARLRIIFCLPSRISVFQEPLVYVELFSELPKRARNDVRMFLVSKSFVDGRQESAVIPLTMVIRSCHLIPRMDDDLREPIPPHKTIDHFNTFYVNQFLDLHTYLTIRSPPKHVQIVS